MNHFMGHHYAIQDLSNLYKTHFLWTDDGFQKGFQQPGYDRQNNIINHISQRNRSGSLELEGLGIKVMKVAFKHDHTC